MAIFYDATGRRKVQLGPGGGGGTLSDGDYQDVTVSGSGTIITIDNNVVSNAQAADMPALSVKANPTNASGDPQDVVAATSGQVFQRNAANQLVFGAVVLSSNNAVTGALRIGNGGTGSVLVDPNADAIFFWDDSANGGAFLTLGSGLSITGTVLTATGGVTDGDKTDITVSSSGAVWTIDNDVVTNAKAADMAQATIKGRAVGAGTGDPTDLTRAQATAVMDQFTTTLQGVVPGSGGGTLNFLRADGTWAAPSIGGLVDGDKGDITVSASGATWTIDPDAVTNAQLANADPLSVIGNSTNASANPTYIAAGLDHQVFRRSGTSLGFGAINLSSAQAVSSRLGLGNGGTGAVLADPGEDALFGWDDSGNTAAFVTFGAGLTLSPTNVLSSSGLNDGDKVDIEVSSSGTVWQIKPNVVTNAELENMLPFTIKGNNTGSAIDPQDLGPAAVANMLPLFDDVDQGLVPGSGGGTTNFLRADGNWAAPGGGGGGTPAGANTQVQYNNAGAFGAEAAFTYNASTNTLTADNHLAAAGGLASAPTYSFIGDTNTGIYQVAADTVGITTGGTAKLIVSTLQVAASVPIGTSAGAAATPAYTFSADPDTGMYSSGANRIDLTTAGIRRGGFSPTGDFEIANTGGTAHVLKQLAAGGAITSGLVNTANIANNTVTFALMQNITANRLLGREDSVSGVVEEIAVTGGIEFVSGGDSIRTTAFTGDVSKATGGTVLTIGNDRVSNAMLSNMAQATIKGRAVGAGTGDPTDLTATQATAILNEFTGSIKGLVPASLGGAVNFLRADGVWAAPAGGGGGAVGIVGNIQYSDGAGAFASEDAFNYAAGSDTLSVGNVVVAGDVAIGDDLTVTGDITAATVTVGNTGLHLLDTNASHDLIIAPGSDLTADHTLTIATGDADRTLTMAGNATISGTNTGDQTITLTGDVTGSGTGSFPVEIVSNRVGNAELRDSTGLSVIGRASNSSGDPADIVAAVDGQVLRRSGVTVGFGAIDLGNTNAVSGDLALSNLAPASAATRLLGRGSASGAGDWQEITLGAGLTMAGTVLSSSGGGGGAPGGSTGELQYNNGIGGFAGIPSTVFSSPMITADGTGYAWITTGAATQPFVWINRGGNTAALEFGSGSSATPDILMRRVAPVSAARLEFSGGHTQTNFASGFGFLLPTQGGGFSDADIAENADGFVGINAVSEQLEWRVNGTWHTIGAGGGAGIAPDDAEYIVAAAHSDLSAERVGTTTATIAWDFGTAAQAKLNVVDASITPTKMSAAARKRQITFSFGNGIDALATGEILTARTTIGYGFTITGWYLIADVSGSIVVDIWGDTIGNYPPTNADSITASAKPTLSSAIQNSSTTLTGWTTSGNAGTVLAVEIESVTSIKWAHLVLAVEVA